jgi:hypothetical protein
MSQGQAKEVLQTEFLTLGKSASLAKLVTTRTDTSGNENGSFSISATTAFTSDSLPSVSGVARTPPKKCRGRPQKRARPEHSVSSVPSKRAKRQVHEARQIGHVKIENTTENAIWPAKAVRPDDSTAVECAWSAHGHILGRNA